MSLPVRCIYRLEYLSAEFFPFAHYNDGVTQCQGFFLVVRYVYESDAQSFMHFFQLHLHILSHFQVECSQWFIE